MNFCSFNELFYNFLLFRYRNMKIFFVFSERLIAEIAVIFSRDHLQISLLLLTEFKGIY